MLVDRQTHRRTDSQTDCNTLLPYWGGVLCKNDVAVMASNLRQVVRRGIKCLICNVINHPISLQCPVVLSVWTKCHKLRPTRQLPAAENSVCEWKTVGIKIDCSLTKFAGRICAPPFSANDAINSLSMQCLWWRSRYWSTVLKKASCGNCRESGTLSDRKRKQHCSCP